MPIVVELEGKPCSGKTTIAKALAKELRQRGISAIDVKDEYASNLQPFVKLTSKLDNSQALSFLDVIKNAEGHLLSYIYVRILQYKIEQSGDYEVIIVQRSPFSFLLAFNLIMKEFGKKLSIDMSNPLFVGLGRKVDTSDLVIYLSAPQSELLKRFEERTNSKDNVHKTLVRNSDFEVKNLLRKIRDRFYELDTSAPMHETVNAVTDLVVSLLQAQRRQNEK